MSQGCVTRVCHIERGRRVRRADERLPSKGTCTAKGDDMGQIECVERCVCGFACGFVCGCGCGCGFVVTCTAKGTLGMAVWRMYLNNNNTCSSAKRTRARPVAPVRAGSRGQR